MLDGLTRYERYARKKGVVKTGTPEWIEKIRSKTREAMLKPEINWKLRQPRSPMTIENRIKHSNLLAGKMPKNLIWGSGSFSQPTTGKFANVKRGHYDCSKGSVFFRSKWEANYALYLDFLTKQGQIKGWDYEKDVFIFEQITIGNRSYIPDFKVYLKDGSFEYHEVKGYMDAKSKTKLRRMARFYPEVKVILIDGPVYRDIAKKIGKMLNFY